MGWRATASARPALDAQHHFNRDRTTSLATASLQSTCESLNKLSIQLRTHREVTSSGIPSSARRTSAAPSRARPHLSAVPTTELDEHDEAPHCKSKDTITGTRGARRSAGERLGDKARHTVKHSGAPEPSRPKLRRQSLPDSGDRPATSSYCPWPRLIEQGRRSHRARPSSTVGSATAHSQAP